MFSFYRSARRHCVSFLFAALGLFFSQHIWAECPPTPAVGNVDFGSMPIVVNPAAPIGEVIKKYTVTLSEVDSKCVTRTLGPDYRLMVGSPGYPVSPPTGGVYAETYCRTSVQGLGIRVRFLGHSQSSVKVGNLGANDIPGGALPGVGNYVMCGHYMTNNCMTPGPVCQDMPISYGVTTKGATLEVELVKTEMTPVNGTLSIPTVLYLYDQALLIKLTGSGTPPVVTKGRTCKVAPDKQGQVWQMGQIDVHEIPTGISKVVPFTIPLMCDAGATVVLQASGSQQGQPVVLSNRQDAGYATGVGVALSYQGQAINSGETIPVPVAVDDGPVNVSLGANYQLVAGPLKPGPFFASATFTIVEK